jgi:GT2 family glycosyltransferase
MNLERLHESNRVSVAVPLYRPSPRFLGEMARSLSAQTRPPDEVIFRDDSEQPAEALVAEVAAGLPYKYLHNDERLGMVRNWNAVVSASTGTQVLLLHQDDALERTALEVMSCAFAGHPDLAVCGVGETRVDELSQPWATRTRPNHRSRVFVSPGVYQLSYPELVYLMLRNGQVFGTPSALMFSRAHFDEVGGFDEELRQSVDIDFALRMAQVGGAIYLTEELVRFRRHGGQATRDNIASGHNLTDRERLYRRHLDPAALTVGQVDRVRASLMVRAVYDGLRAARYFRWPVVWQASSQAREFSTTPRALTDRLVELIRWQNDDAR